MSRADSLERSLTAACHDLPGFAELVHALHTSPGDESRYAWPGLGVLRVFAQDSSDEMAWVWTNAHHTVRLWVSTTTLRVRPASQNLPSPAALNTLLAQIAHMTETRPKPSPPPARFKPRLVVDNT